MRQNKKIFNIDLEVVNHFGNEWAKYNYLNGIAAEALDEQFNAYTEPLDFGLFKQETSVAADFGAGSGRWAERLKPYFKRIYVLEPSESAFEILRKRFKSENEFILLNEGIESNSIPNGSLDLAMSLGVLHHIPDTKRAIKDIYTKIAPGGSFLCYLYYKVEDKSLRYRAIFFLVNIIRNLISRMPNGFRMVAAKIIAISIYLPLAKYSMVQMNRGKDVSNIPLHHYANKPFIMLENDALDRFGTRLEQRFNKADITEMLEEAGFDLNTLKFSMGEPFWTFTISKSSNA